MHSEYAEPSYANPLCHIDIIVDSITLNMNSMQYIEWNIEIFLSVSLLCGSPAWLPAGGQSSDG